MLSWLVRRILTSLLLVFLVVTAVFFVVRLAPGDPLDQVVTQRFGPEERQLMRQRYGLDQPLADQYLRWLQDLAGGDFGMSFDQQRPVREILAQTLPATLLLTISAYGLHLLLAVAAALVMVRFRGRWLDHLVQGTGLAFYSVPGFWLGLMAIMLLSRQAGWFPPAGMYSADAAFMGGARRFFDLLHHLTLPVLTLALGSFMGTARYLRSSLEEALDQDYILAARSRGIPERTILMRHALRNALLPVITLVGLSIPFLLGGAVVTEVVFGWPGMGRVTVNAIWTRDYPVIMATTLVAALTVVAGSLIADILYTRADPRVSLQDAGRPK